MSMASEPLFEARDPRFDPDYGRHAVTPPPRSPWRTCMLGCLVVAVVAILLIAAGTFWVVKNFPDLLATGASELLNQLIDTSNLSAEERREMKLEVQRLADAIRDGRMTNQQFWRVAQEVMNSPLLTLFVVSTVEKQYLEKSGLSEEEKAEGRKTLQRFVRGSVDGKINEAATDRVMKHIADKRRDDNWEMRSRVTDDELRAALTAAKQAADEAQIPELPEIVDPSAEFRRIIDQALGEAKAEDR